MTLTPELAGALSVVIGAVAAGVVKILSAIQATRGLVVAGQDVSNARGVVRDKKIKEIHLLVNSRLLTVLRLLVLMTKKESERTNAKEDLDAYNVAQLELARAEAGASASASARNNTLEDTADDASIASAEEKLHLVKVQTGVADPKKVA